jgi:tRNA nucleotidyltransferase (CCA-adding enzyme)
MSRAISNELGSEGANPNRRLLKSFMMAARVYGAEIETQGFSGYLAEVLILKHGTFLDAIKSFADFVPTGTPLILSLHDPVDESRDLGTAVSGEKLGRLIVAARAFISKPHESYFEALSGRQRPRMKGNVVAVVFDHRRISEDILWGELRRSLRHLVKHLEEKGFRVARCICASNNVDSSAFLFIPEYEYLPRLEQRLGPSLSLKRESRRFVTLNQRRTKLMWVDDQARIRILRNRTHTSFIGLLSRLVHHDAGSIGASKEVVRGLRKSSRILTGTQLAKSRSEEWLMDGVSEIVSDTPGIREA